MRNVGVSTRSTFIENNEAVHRQVMELNLFAPWILTHDVLPGKMYRDALRLMHLSSCYCTCDAYTNDDVL